MDVDQLSAAALMAHDTSQSGCDRRRCIQLVARRCLRRAATMQDIAKDAIMIMKDIRILVTILDLFSGLFPLASLQRARPSYRLFLCADGS